jgi:hypothetical protein
MVVAGGDPAAGHRRTVRSERARVMSENKIIREVDGRTFELTQYARFPGYEVRETTGGMSMPLTRDIDLPPLEVLTDEVLLAMTEPRRVRLAATMQQYRIVSGPDYQYEDDYELLYSTEPVGRYVVVSGDETYHWIHVVDSREAAAASVRDDIEDQFSNEYPHHPIEIRDLDTGQPIPFKYSVVVELTD